MTRIAVLGANGQVGAELCLLLARQPGVTVVPVCRTRLGSAYLRSMGLAVRHGSPADAAAAPALFGDCDVVANLALVSTLRDPAAARATNAALLANVAAAAPAARHVYFSTMSVYGDPEVGQRLVFRNSYGADKFRSEALVRRVAARHRQPTWILRLGHVSGELQGITRYLRDRLRAGPVPVPDPARASNTTYVVAIADALLAVAAGRLAPGTFDLFNTPQWTWQQVLEREAAVAGVVPVLERVGDPRPAGLRGLVRGLAGPLVRSLAGQPALRRLGSRAVVWLPETAYRRVKAAWAVQSAGADLARLRPPVDVPDPFRRRPLGRQPAPGLTPTAELLAAAAWAFPAAGVGPAWPADLPPALPQAAAGPVPAGAVPRSPA